MPQKTAWPPMRSTLESDEPFSQWRIMSRRGQHHTVVWPDLRRALLEPSALGSVPLAANLLPFVLAVLPVLSFFKRHCLVHALHRVPSGSHTNGFAAR